LAVAICIILAAGAVPPEWGVVTFTLGWAALCIVSVLAGRMLVWFTLCVGPLALISLAYWLESGSLEDPFGVQSKLGGAFIVMSFITAATGVLSIVAGPTSKMRYSLTR
jgi:hypothetical protein